jgi:hypothetical protein
MRKLRKLRISQLSQNSHFFTAWNTRRTGRSQNGCQSGFPASRLPLPGSSRSLIQPKRYFSEKLKRQFFNEQALVARRIIVDS